VKEQLSNSAESTKIGPKHFENIKKIEQKLERLQDMFVDGEIDKTDSQTTKIRYENLIAELKEKENKVIDEKSIIELYQKAINKMESIGKQYNNTDIEGKRLLLGSIFPNKIHFENKKVRTTDVNPILNEIASINKAYSGIKNGTNLKN
jgi:predicted  nucleic acid-binding Zn-ribbon protein